MSTIMRKHILYSLALAVPIALVGMTPVHAFGSKVNLSANAGVRTNLQESRLDTRIEVRQDSLVNARKLATAIFNDRFIKTLSDIRARVAANTTLGVDAKASLLTKLDAEISWFTEQRDSIQAAASVTAVKSITADARARFLVDAKDIRRLYIDKGYVVALQKVIDNLNKNVVTKLDAKIAKLSDAGVNVSAQTALMVTAKSDIATAQANVTAVHNSTTVTEARTSFQAARAAVRQAKQVLKQILTSLKGLLPKPTVKASASVSAGAEAETR